MNVYEPIAIIGLACRLPDAPDIGTFKKNLIDGHCAIRAMSTDDIKRQGINAALMENPSFVNAGTVVKDHANFDYGFFGLSPKEAELMDPQHRLFLEECRKLLDIANLTRDLSNIGVYAGCRQSTYQMLLPALAPEKITQTETFQQLMGNDKDYLATRVAYQLNFTGPAMSVQSACSTSLVAVHQACQALRQHECDAALAGGVGISFPQGLGYQASEGMIFSNDGKCRPFSADGSGIVAGNGLGIVALKRLQDAQNDGDLIHAVIKGSALSNDGNAKLGFTAPGKQGQKRAIQKALKNSGVNPNDIGLLEAHGTGTPLGDPIEVQAITEVYKALGVPNQHCAIGSVKGNVGHLDTAAGITSLLKSVLAVRDNIMPKSLYCQPFNSNISFDKTPFYPLTEQQTWPEHFTQRTAAVSSFGIGGTNCHMIIQQAPENTKPVSQSLSTKEFTERSQKESTENQCQILAVSNHNSENLTAQAEHYVAALESSQLQSQCRTAALRRQHFSSRIALVGKTPDELRADLVMKKTRPVNVHSKNPSVAWVFSGQGSQKSEMGKNLYSSHKVFKKIIDQCNTLFAKAGIPDLKETLFDAQYAERLNQTLYTQPALFSWQYAMSKLLQHWGVIPQWVMGHSIGEFAACVVAGHLPVESAIELVAHRALLMEHNTAAGNMLAVRSNEASLLDVLSTYTDIVIASINGKENFVLSGPIKSIDALQKDIKKAGITCQLLRVNRSFHSSSMDRLKTAFYNHQISLSVPVNTTASFLPEMYSSLTASKTELGDLDTDYWFSQLRQPVNFYKTTQSLAMEQPDHIIEIGPDGSFSSLLKHQHGLNQSVFSRGSIISSAASQSIETFIAELYCLGYDTPLEEYYSNKDSVNKENFDQYSSTSKLKTTEDHVFATMPSLIFSPTYCWPEKTIKPKDITHTLEKSTLQKNVDNKKHQEIKLWQWQWQSLPPLYQQTLFEIKKNAQERWCVIGSSPYATDLADMIQSSIVNNAIAMQCDKAPVEYFDYVVDTRLLTFDNEFIEGLSVIKTGAAYLVAWGEYAKIYPDSHIITLVANASHIDVPHQGNGLWPFLNVCRTYANENPRVNHTCLNLSDKNNISEKSLLLASQQSQHSGCVFSWHDNNLHSLIVNSERCQLITPITTSTVNPAWHWQSEHFTVIAGLGSVGLGLAQWLAEQGCNKFAFIVKKTLNSKQQQLVSGLELKGATVTLLQASLTSSESLDRVFAEANIIVSRVFHTAHDGVQKLHPLEDSQAFVGALPVKIEGSQNLYHALKEHPLDMFCMFSSVTSIMAMSGASGYATANAWQDTYAAYLRSVGVPALTVSWGQLQLSRETEHVTQVDRTGITALSAEQAFSVMTYLIEQNISGASPIIYDPASLVRTVEILPATLPCLQSVLRIDNTKKEQTLLDINHIHELDHKEKQQRIHHYIYALITQRLKFSQGQLNAEKLLTEQGVDSLVFLELVQIINQQLQLNLPSTVGYEFGTVNALAVHISQQLTQDDIAFSNKNPQSQMIIENDVKQRFEPFPLTDLQQAFWIGRLDGFSMGSVSCHQYVELELDNLDYKKLEAAWNKLILRHEMMRCIILPSGQNQILEKVDHYPIVYRNLYTLNSDERENTLQDIRERMSFQVFDPQQWPLFELSVSQVSERVSRVHLDMDLLVFDIQSFRIIYGELAVLLDSKNVEARYQQLPVLTLSFRDYLLAEKKQEDTISWQQAKNFWINRLETIPNAPELPTRKQVDQQQRAEYRTLDHRLSPTAWKQLRKYANQYGLTPSSVLLTAYTQALALYSKSAEFTLNITYFNRKNVHEQMMDICGDFTSLMLLPVESRAQAVFAHEAKRIQGDMWSALNHRDFNGIRVMRELGRHRQTGADSIEMPVVFTSMIGMDFDDPSQADWPLMSKQVFEINQTPQVWIDYQASEYGGALMTRWFVAKNLFESSIIEGIFSVYTQFLEQLANDETQWQQATPDLRLAEDQALYQQLNNQNRNNKSTQNTQASVLMPELVQQYIHTTPKNTAIIFQEQSLDYGELGRQINRIAHYLLAADLPASTPVAVLMPKQALSIIAALGIQSAGGCYVPINSEYDNTRLEHILTDLQPFAVLSVTATIENILSGIDISALNTQIIDLQTVDLSTYDTTPPPPRQTEDALAYIIYTSGSTGRPKGVMLDHEKPINTLKALSDTLGITSQDRTLALCACHHDMSIFDSYGILSNGGSVIFPDPAHLYDAEHWLDLIAAHNPTIINAVPSFITLLMDAQATDHRALPAPRHIMMGGDWIPINLVQRINALWPDCQLHSIGGPTETAIVSTHYPIQRIDPSWTAIPYGKPLANQCCYLLTPDGRDCPAGIVGEICMGDMAISMGYWNDLEMTEKRYRLHTATGKRLFHTGDLGCLRPDGHLDIVGRIDNQINHNGLRIEPGEIESTISQYSDIKEAVVIQAGQPHKQLHGFITKATNYVEALHPININNINNINNNQKVNNTSANWLRVNTLADQLSRVPPKGFNVDQYSARFNAMERLSTWAMLATIQSAGFLQTPQQQASTTNIAKALNVSKTYQKILLGWIKVLVGDGYLQINASGEQALENVSLEIEDQLLIATDMVLETQQLDSLREQITVDIEKNGTSAEQRLWALYTQCLDKINQLLTAEFNPLSLMFEDGKTDFAESHYRENIVSQHFNALAGKTASALLQEKHKIRILEFGAGIGSVTHDILNNLSSSDFSYDFTDISSYFLDNAKEMFSAWPQMRYSHFNINQDPGLQQLVLGSYDLIIGANVLHDAINVHTSIGYLRQLLKPCGHLMLVEGTMNPRFQMVSLGFVEGLTHYEDERLKTSLPMISAPLWKQYLQQDGFIDAASFPPKNHPVEKMNYHLIIAENNRQSSHLNTESLQQWLREKLPDSMIPTRWHHLNHMPLSLNGKVDRIAMAETVNTEFVIELAEQTPLQSETAHALARIWEEVLNSEVECEEANFFTLGGDSLLMTRLSHKIQHHFQISLDLVSLLRHPKLGEQANLIEASLLALPVTNSTEEFEEGVI
jgi:amino acid adenylation domain-containing protein